MATTSNTYTGNGSNKLFSITFPYLDTSDIDVYLNGTLQTIITQYTFANATTVEFVAAPANGAVILLDRSTDDSALQATFFPGSSIKASDLNDDFDQVLYIAQETSNEATTATTTAATATTTANTALSQSAAAISTANTASSNASAALSTANTASTNASNAVTTANTASSNATTAVNTANAATSTANSAASNASTALSTANTALTNANSAVTTANTASSNATAAVSTANTASTNASTAVTTANNAVTTANSAVTTANTANTNSNTAVTTANAAAAAIANAVLYTTVANVAAIPGSPANNAAVEVTNSTGIESFTPLSGLPAGFIGSSGLSVRIIYQTVGATWTWIQYFPNDPEARYLKLAGGTLTGTLAHPLGAAATPSITFTGDLDTGIYSPGADQVAVSTGGTGRLFVDANGNVGVGTSSPANFAGFVTLALADSSGSEIDFIKGSTVQGSLYNANDIFYVESKSTVPTAFATNNTERLRITSAGLVGIGTSSPQVKTHVADTNPLVVGDGSGSFAVTYETGTTAIGQGGGIFLGTPASAGSYFNTYIKAARESAAGTNSAAALAFGTRVDGGSNTERLRITSGGNVGINTTTPGALLDVAASVPTVRLTDVDGPSPYHEFAGTGNGALKIAADEGNTGSNPSSMQFFVDGTEGARIDSSGRLLVGKSSARSFPSSITGLLQVESTSVLSSALGLTNNQNTGSGPSLIFGKSRGASVGSNTVVQVNDQLGAIWFTGTDGSQSVVGAEIRAYVDGTPGANDMPGRIVLSTTANGASTPTERMRIAEDGDVFFNTTTVPTSSTPGVYFTTSGRVIHYSTTATASARVFEAGGATGYARIMGDGDLENSNNRYTGVSDVKLKQNIEDATSQWDDIKSIRVRKYEFISNPDRRHIGVVAQELEEVCPGLVIERDLNEETGETVKSVAYSVLYMKAVKALQEAMERIETLEAKVAALESKP